MNLPQLRKDILLLSLVLIVVSFMPGCSSISPDCEVEDGIPFVDKCVIHPKTTKQIREVL